jgi:subfamily B ATP-binding cassette protein MsbA
MDHPIQAGIPLVPKRKRGTGRAFIMRGMSAFAGLGWLLGLIGLGMVIWDPEWMPLDPSSLKRIVVILFALGLFTLLIVAAMFFGLRARSYEWERVFELILTQRRSFNLMLVGSAILVLSELMLPLALKFVLDDVVNVKRDARLLTVLMITMVGLLLIRGAAGYLRTFNAQGLAYRIATDLRRRLYSHLQRLSYSFFDRARQGELMSKITNDVVVLQNFILNSSEDFFVAPLKVLGAVACVFFLNWQLALVILAAALLTALLLRVSGSRLRWINNEVQRQMGELTAQLAEGINTIRLAQSFGLERMELGKFNQTNEQAYQRILGHARLSAILLPTIEFLGFISPLIIIAVLGFQAITKGQLLEVGALVAIAGYGDLVANPLGKLSRLLVTLAMGEAASYSINSVLETRVEIADRQDAVAVKDTDGYLQFENVSLRYAAGEPKVLDRIDLEIPPGQILAIVGESGSGKSSLIHLVPRFYEASKGRILLDGVDLRDITLGSLRRQVGIVSQDTILIHGTVRDNIAYGVPYADEKDIIDAAMSANAHNFIMEFPDGYDTLVGERGVTLSGGQRQRVAIARALLRDPRILLLDEATSALDSISEAIVQDALNKLMYGRTTLLVAHRLSTVKRADRIIVLKHGRIIESGTHHELMGIKGGEYARLVKLQGLDQS